MPAPAPNQRLRGGPQLMFEPKTGARDLLEGGRSRDYGREEARMTHWNDPMVDRPETDDGFYLAGWTISGLAVLGTIVAVWVLGI